MSNSIQDLLKDRSFNEPPEIKIVQAFVESHFKQKPQVLVSPTQIVIGVKSSALAGALRPLLPQLQEKLETDKQLRIRIQ